MNSYSAKYSLYDVTARIPESEMGNVTFSILSEPSNMGKTKNSKRTILILTGIFIVVTVVTGVVVWKVTKDAYQGDGSDGASRVEKSGGAAENSKGTEHTQGTRAPDAKGGGDKTASTQRSYTDEELKEKPWLSLRLTRDVLPVHYDIVMYPDFYDDGSTFYGNETVQIEVKRATRFVIIHIHATYVNVTNTQLRDSVTRNDIDIARAFYYAPNEFWVVEAVDELPANAVVDLVLGFEGSLVKGIVGIYKSTYLNTQTNRTRAITTSKFEPTYARRAFPCFDEPNVKAEYTITLIHRPDYTALSNMPQDGAPVPTADYPGLVSSKFERSVKMSTYLVCYIVCDFDYRSTTSESGIPIRVFATPDKIDQVNHALDLARHTLDRYEELFNMSYPLPKQDLIAIPDFVSGAMEHWGLITFRESRLLIDNRKSSLANIERVSLVIAHEMAHMWFGNIVTMDWWNDLWLNEGFASYMEYLGVNDKQPEWRILDKFLTRDLFLVMSDDSEVSSHPIIVNVERPSQITSVFDIISYSKGSSVIRMLKAMMGEESFFQGVASYLKRFKWGNAKTDDLWQSLSEVNVSGDFDVKHIMDSWTVQDGFPYVNISLVTSDSGVTTVMATQKRFMSNPEVVVDPATSPKGYKWFIPLTYKTSRGDVGRENMDMTDVTFTAELGLTQPNSWVKFNTDQMGFYRVLYPKDMWQSFSTHLIQNDEPQWAIPSRDRAGLLNDAFSLAGAGLLSYEVPLQLMAYLGKERQYVPWAAALDGGINYIHRMLRLDPDFGLWRTFLADQLRKAVSDLGFTDSDSQNHVTRTVRPLLMSTACKAEDETVLNHVRDEFRAWLDQGQVPTSVNLRGIVYSYGLSSFGTEEDWDTIWAKYLVEPSPQEKERLIFALAEARQPHLIMRLLGYAKEGKHIKRQDFFTIINRVGRNGAAVNLVWDWARENYQAFIDRFTITDRYFGRMIYYMVRDYNTEFKLNQVKSLFEKFPEAGAGERYRKMALESIERNIYWMRHFRPVIVRWLKGHAKQIQ